ncbi:MAG TPA: helix-hairpin-helix domain-containing protein [Propionibacteriaceae bacterium]|nr:helix-hairpin-helix domain-containing protein [Propionibacteriaceae bacterium]
MSPDPPEPGSPVRAARVAGVVEFGRDHLALVLVAGVVAIGIAITYLTRAQAHTVPMAVPSPVPAAAPPATAATPQATGGGTGGASVTSPAAASATPRLIVVQVLGAVKRPGVISVPEGTRVHEAIARCGGLAPGSDTGDLNLAAVLRDADQVVIGTRAQPGGSVRNGSQPAGLPGGSATPADLVVDLNTATLEQLDQIPGVGPVTAQKIVDWRSQHGGFTAVTELREIDGIGAKTFARIAPHVRV